MSDEYRGEERVGEANANAVLSVIDTRGDGGADSKTGVQSDENLTECHDGFYMRDSGHIVDEGERRRRRSMVKELK